MRLLCLHHARKQARTHARTHEANVSLEKKKYGRNGSAYEKRRAGDPERRQKLSG